LIAKEILLGVLGFSFGVLAAAGVFTVLVAVGLVPRFAGKTHTANKALLYEDMVIAGTIIGCFMSVFERYSLVGNFFRERFSQHLGVWEAVGNVALTLFGVFSGMFIGCLALAIAEILDSIPIFARRFSFRHGIGVAILAIAAGKLTGSLFYFVNHMYRIME
jgi:stage V sporulation protein AB